MYKIKIALWKTKKWLIKYWKINLLIFAAISATVVPLGIHFANQSGSGYLEHKSVEDKFLAYTSDENAAKILDDIYHSYGPQTDEEVKREDERLLNKYKDKYNLDKALYGKDLFMNKLFDWPEGKRGFEDKYKSVKTVILSLQGGPLFVHAVNEEAVWKKLSEDNPYYNYPEELTAPDEDAKDKKSLWASAIYNGWISKDLINKVWVNNWMSYIGWSIRNIKYKETIELNENQTPLTKNQKFKRESDVHTKGSDYWRKELKKSENFYDYEFVEAQNMLMNDFSRTSYAQEYVKEVTITTLALLHKAVQYFKDKGMRVILNGTSYGGSLLYSYLSRYGNDSDKMFINSADINDLSHNEAGKWRTTDDYDEKHKIIDFRELTSKNMENDIELVQENNFRLLKNIVFPLYSRESILQKYKNDKIRNIINVIDENDDRFYKPPKKHWYRNNKKYINVKEWTERFKSHTYKKNNYFYKTSGYRHGLCKGFCYYAYDKKYDTERERKKDDLAAYILYKALSKEKIDLKDLLE